jgi:hypothetical protein
MTSRHPRNKKKARKDTKEKFLASTLLRCLGRGVGVTTTGIGRKGKAGSPSRAEGEERQHFLHRLHLPRFRRRRRCFHLRSATKTKTKTKTKRKEEAEERDSNR